MERSLKNGGKGEVSGTRSVRLEESREPVWYEGMYSSKTCTTEKTDLIIKTLMIIELP